MQGHKTIKYDEQVFALSFHLYSWQCVLSGIIVVALKGMYTQAGDLKRFHKESKLESFTWMITFIAVVLVDVDIG